MGDIGRRERNKAEKRARILSAASAAFAERGYAAVTTQEIADAADVAAGTLFRYAATKAELLLMVYNHRVAEALAQGRRDAETAAGGDAVLALLAPLLAQSRTSAENTARYRHEVIFGAEGTFRREALTLIEQLVDDVAGALRRAWARERAGVPAPDPRPAADAVFAALHVTILVAARPDLATDPLADLECQVSIVVRGYLATPSPAQEGAPS